MFKHYLIEVYVFNTNWLVEVRLYTAYAYVLTKYMF